MRTVINRISWMSSKFNPFCMHFCVGRITTWEGTDANSKLNDIILLRISGPTVSLVMQNMFKHVFYLYFQQYLFLFIAYHMWYTVQWRVNTYLTKIQASLKLRKYNLTWMHLNTNLFATWGFQSNNQRMNKAYNKFYRKKMTVHFVSL